MSTDPWQVGLEHEQSVSASERRQRGAWYTPRQLVETLVAEAIDADSIPSFVVDPTCGGGAFLLGTLDRLVELGLAPVDALERVGGLDIAPGAVAATRQALVVWAERQGLAANAVYRVRLEVGDALEPWPAAWPIPDLVIGNPPFATPLKNGAFPEAAERAKQLRPELFGPYADLAAVHLALDVERTAGGGRVCLVLPQSLLAGRDCAGLRQHLAALAPPRSLWATAAAVFDAGVRVWAPILDVGGEAGPVRLSTGFEPDGTVTTSVGTWAELAAEALGTPHILLDGARTLSELTSTTAGFRDEFYGLAAACVEGTMDDDRPRLVTVGSLDPLECSWGSESMRIAKRRWDRPVVEPSLLEEKIEVWLQQQLRPKVVLPTQSKVFEPVIDRTGRLAPLTPVLSIHAELENLDLVAAVLLAPPVVAWARRRWFGSAMSVQAIKLAARDVGSIPLPPDLEAWNEAARLIAGGERTATKGRATAMAVAEVMNGAYNAAPGVHTWWLDRLG